MKIEDKIEKYLVNEATNQEVINMFIGDEFPKK
jgi:hypothetical protein